MPYDCEILYKPGKDTENPADFISWHANDLYTPPAENATEACVYYLCNNLIPKAMTIDEVQQETAKSPVLCKISKAIADNNWVYPKVKLFLNVKDELSVCNGFILRNHLLVLPHSLPNEKYCSRKSMVLFHRQVSGKSQNVSPIPSSNYRYFEKSRAPDHEQTSRCTMERNRR